MKHFFGFIAASILASSMASAAVKSQSFNYAVDKTKMKSEMFFEEAAKDKKPGILIVHDWMGISDFTKGKAKQLAEQGYVAMAVDIYGEGNNPKDQKEAAALAGKFKSDRALLRAHVKAAYDSMIASGKVNPEKILVMGYCFGGTTALELARSGAKLAGTASFHGGLESPTPADAKNIKGKVLVMHGADDPYVPAKEVDAFKKEMADAKVNMKFVAYPGAVHAFAVPMAGNDKSKGAAYDKNADEQSWKEFTAFAKQVL